MGLFDNWKRFIHRIENFTEQDLNAAKYLIMFLIIADLFGVYYFLSQKKLAILLLILLIFALTFIFIVSKPKNPPEPLKTPPKPLLEKKSKRNHRVKRRKPKKMPENKQESEEYLDLSERKEESSDFEFGEMGLPSANDVQNRMDDALGKSPF